MRVDKPGLLKLSTGDTIDPIAVESVCYLPWEQMDGGWTRSHSVQVGLRSGRSLTYTKATQADAYALRESLAAEIQAGLTRPTTLTLEG